MPVSIPGIDNLPLAVKWVIASAIIFVLLALFALILRRLTGGRTAIMGDRGRARQPRLGIVDVYDLDRQRQLILLRRDNVEHLLLVGGPNDVVVETNIVRVAGARLPTVQTDTDRGEAPRGAEPSFDPVLGATLGSEALTTGASRRPGGGAGLEPVLKPTRVTAAPNGGLGGAPPRLPPARANLEPQPGEQSGLDMTRQLEAALRQPPAQPVERQRPQPVPEPRSLEPVPRPEPVRTEPARVAPVRAEPPRQRAAEPVRSTPPPPAPPPVASPPPVPLPAPPPARPEPVSAPAPAPRPPVPVPAPRPVVAPPPPPPAPTPAPPTKPDPFSIEDIEAEFARLLGRPLDKKD